MPSSPQAAAQQLRNNGVETLSPRPRIQQAAHHTHHHHHFQSTVSVQKLRRFNTLILIFRFGAFCSAAAGSVFMLVNPKDPDSPRWHDFDAFRFVLAANAIVALYSLFEMGASVWEISSGVTLLSEIVQVWFDFVHDQVFAYLLLSADSAGTELSRTMKGTTNRCRLYNAFCIQTDISIALGFAGFLFLGLSSLLSGFRVVCFIIRGSRFNF